LPGLPLKMFGNINFKVRKAFKASPGIESIVALAYIRSPVQ
jgi:hypothetical protein